MIDDIIVTLGWDQAAQWGKKAKNGVKWENIGKQSETSGGLGMEKGRRSLETCLCHPFHSPDYTSRLASLAIFFSFFLWGAWSQAIVILNIIRNKSLKKTEVTSDL